MIAVAVVQGDWMAERGPWLKAERARPARGVLVMLMLLTPWLAGCPERTVSPGLTFGVTPEQHVEFPITADAIHALARDAADGPITCASCHGTEGSFARFTCVGCHEHRAEGVDPDGSAGMNERHRATPQYVYESAACLRCHPAGLAAELPRSAHDEFFPIDVGAAHFTTACSGCHIEPSDRTVVSCTSCHEDRDNDGLEDHGLQQLRNAHGPEMQELGYQWTTAKCLECHERSQNPGLLAHEPFPIAPDDVHEDVSCADCHAAPTDRADLTCTSCHVQVDDGTGERDAHGDVRMFELHANGEVPGYAYVSRSCYACHEDAQVPGALNHEELFPIGPTTVHALDTLIDEPPTLVKCASCHQAENDYEDVTCTSCHAHAQALTDPQHAEFPEYTYDSTSCVFCHKGGLRAFDHSLVSDFPVSALSDSHLIDDWNTAAVDGLACADCHASQDNRSQMRCTSCHDHEQPAELLHHGAELSRFGYVYESGACLECHETSQVPGLIDHEPEFPLLPPSGNGAHQPLSCADCHADNQRRSETLSCTTCHEPTSPEDAREVHGEPRMDEVHAGFPEYIWAAQSCIGCHANGTADGAAENLDHVWFPVSDGATHAVTARGGTLTCADCHPTAGDYTVATIGCVSCHQQIDEGGGARDVHGAERLGALHTGVDGYLHDGPTCLECHPNGEPTGNFNHVDFPIAAASAHEGIACTACHAPGPPKSDLAALQCKQCHDATVNLNPTVPQIHGGLPGFVDASPSCYGCHPNSEVAPPIDHEPFFPVAAGTPHAPLLCTDCHINPSVRQQVTCTGCHTDENSDGLLDHDVSAMLAAHGPGMTSLGYQWNTASCRDCHARAQVPGVLNHEPAFPIALGTVHSGKQCVDCHVSKQDRTQLLCVACHQQVDDGTGARDVHGELRMEEVHVTTGTVPGYAFESRACFGCHQQAQVPGVMDHEAFFPIGAASFHPLGTSIDTPLVLVECVTCHQDSANQRNVTCTSCHAHEQPTMDASHAGFPEYTYQSTSCVFCHERGTKQLNHALASAFPVAAAGDSHKLDDPLTTTVDGLLCSECHLSRTDRALLTCTSCHQHTVAQETLDHGASMSNFGYRYDSGACYACHTTSQVPGLFDHEPIFPLLPPSGVTSHQALSCADCHASRTDRGGSLTCTTCHQPTSAQDAREVHSQPRLAEVHNGFVDYQWSPQSCVGCHADGTAASAAQNLNHVWFPTSAGTTHALTASGGQLVCADCHTTAGDSAQFECVQCHLNVNDGTGDRPVHGSARMTERHAGVNGFVFASPDCYACHPNGEPAGTLDHTGFPIAAGSAHEAETCTACHTGTAPKSDLTALGCAQCHATENTSPTIAAIHNGIPGFANDSPSCYACHPNAERVGPMEHAAFFPIAAGSVHASAAYMAKVSASQTSCTACHASRTDRTNELCATCHATVPVIPTTAHTGVRGFSNTSPQCKACHADAQVMLLTAHPRDGSRSWHAHRSSTCQNCHINQPPCLLDPNCYNNSASGQPNPAAQPAYRSDKPWAYDFSKYGCLGCHEHKKSSMDSRHSEQNGYQAYFNPPCIHCHNP